MLCQLSSCSCMLCKSLIFCSTATFALSPHSVIVLPSSSLLPAVLILVLIVLGLKTWQASGPLGQYDKSDCCGVLSSILRRLFGGSLPSEIFQLLCWRLVEKEIAGLAIVDGVISMLIAGCRTLSFHVLFNGAGYATCRCFFRNIAEHTLLETLQFDSCHRRVSSIHHINWTSTSQHKISEHQCWQGRHQYDLLWWKLLPMLRPGAKSLTISVRTGCHPIARSQPLPW